MLGPTMESTLGPMLGPMLGIAPLATPGAAVLYRGGGLRPLDVEVTSASLLEQVRKGGGKRGIGVIVISLGMCDAAIRQCESWQPHSLKRRLHK